jgi:hypothetical protein
MADELTKDQLNDTYEGYPIHKTLYETLPEPMIDEASATVTYRGFAPLGTGFTEKKWKIMRITKTNAVAPYGVILTEYAEGDMNYNNAWSARASLYYAR